MNPNDFLNHIALHIAEHNRINSLNRRRRQNLFNTKSKMNTSNMNPGNLSAFAASLNNLTREEISQAKVLYIKNAITSYKSSCQNIPLGLLWMSFISLYMFFGSITVFPLFALLPLLFLFIAFSNSKNFLRTMKQQIANAIEIWKEDLGDDYLKLKGKLEKIKANIPLFNIPIV